MDGFSNLVRQYRRDEAITVRTAAAQAGIPTATFSRLERGEGSPRLITVVKAARWIGIPDVQALELAIRDLGPEGFDAR